MRPHVVGPHAVGSVEWAEQFAMRVTTTFVWMNVFRGAGMIVQGAVPMRTAAPVIYPGEDLSWRDATPHLRNATSYKMMRDGDYEPMGLLWDAFNRNVKAVRSVDKNGWFDSVHNFREHRRIAVSQLSGRVSEGEFNHFAELHMGLRNFLLAGRGKTNGPSSGDRVLRKEDGFRAEFQRLFGISGEVKKVKEVNALVKDAIRYEAELSARETIKKRPLSEEEMSALIRRVFPKAKYSEAQRAQVQVAVAFARVRFRHGSLDILTDGISHEVLRGRGPARAVLGHIAGRLGVSQNSLVLSTGMKRDEVSNCVDTGKFLPRARFVRLVNLVEAPKAAPLAYAFYRPILADNFRVEFRETGVVLHAIDSVHSYEELKKMDFGSTVRGYRGLRGVTVEKTGVEKKTLARFENGGKLPWSFDTVETLRSRLDMPRSETILLAGFIDLPRWIPVYDMHGNLLVTPETHPFSPPFERLRVKIKKGGGTGKTSHVSGSADVKVDSLGGWFRQVLGFRRLSLSAVAEGAGLSRKTLGEIKNNEHRPGLKVVKGISKVLGEPVEAIAERANNTAFSGSKPISLEGLKARRPVLLDDQSDGNRLGDRDRSRMYRAFYDGGAEGPSQGEVLWFARKNLGRLKVDPKLNLSIDETAKNVEGVRYAELLEAELNRRPLRVKQEKSLADYYGIDVRELQAARERTFAIGHL